MKPSYYLGIIFIIPFLVIIQQLSLKIIELGPKIVLLLLLIIIPNMLKHFAPNVYYNNNSIPEQRQ